jgi:plasmid stabilization system protein ParE
MAYQIVWTAAAENDFYSIIEYLQQHWSDYSAEKFSARIIKGWNELLQCLILQNLHRNQIFK